MIEDRREEVIIKSAEDLICTEQVAVKDFLHRTTNVQAFNKIFQCLSADATLWCLKSAQSAV